MKYLLTLFLTPSAYLTNWRGFLVNQAGHAAIGLVLAHFIGWATLAVYAAWEIGQLVYADGRINRKYGSPVAQMGAYPSDGIGDWAFVASGVMAVLIHPAFLVLTVARLIEGVLLRTDR